MRPCFTILNHLGHAERVQPLPADLFPGALRQPRELDKPFAIYSEGTLLSSGDGVLSVRAAFESDAPTRWRFACSGMELSFKVPPGRHTRVLPVLESDESTGVFWLAAADAPALEADVTQEVATDMDLDSKRQLAVSAMPDGSSRATGPAIVHEHDSLSLAWDEARSGPLTVEVRGLNVDGQAITRRWHFKTAGGARTAAFTLGAMASGRLDSVLVTGLDQPMRMDLVPLRGGTTQRSPR